LTKKQASKNEKSIKKQKKAQKLHLEKGVNIKTKNSSKREKQTKLKND
jgi:predicted GIY-YIG superfamily endonuclease